MYVSLMLLVLGACTPERRIEGQVVDIWGEAIPSATVVMEGAAERPLTDASGRFSLPLVPGQHRIKAGREGYIQEHQEIEVVEGADPPHPVFQLYPKPEQAGFYLVGADEYHRLEPQPIQQLDSGPTVVRGIPSTSSMYVQKKRVRLVFHTPLKLDQVMRLGLRLHRLDLLGSAEMMGPLGPQKVDVNLYTAAAPVETEIKPLRSRDDYLIESTADLEPGEYAFDTQGMLTGKDPSAFSEIPEPLRVAYVLSLRE